MEPEIMFIRVSENCNAGCFMCGYAGNHNSYNITETEFENLLTMMRDTGTYRLIRFTGGEPLLHPLLAKFITRCKEEGYTTSIISNGYLLPSQAEKLANAGLDQIIISIDGSKSEINDNLRGLKNGLEHIKLGVKKLREKNPNIHIRANTVISRENIDDLLDLYSMLEEMQFDSWSLIPIRGNSSIWKKEELLHYKEIYEKFKEKQKTTTKPELLGYSSSFFGRNDDEVNKSLLYNYRITPNDKCNLVDLVRFYIPDKKLIIPCNCAAHRIHQIDVEYNDIIDPMEKASLMADWLRENGPSCCTGCEPLNAYLADNPLILKKSLFKY